MAAFMNSVRLKMLSSVRKSIRLWLHFVSFVCQIIHLGCGTLRISPPPHNYRYHPPSMPGQFNPAFMISTIHPFLELLARFEKRQLLRFDLNLLAGFGVSAGVCLVFFNGKWTKTPDFNPIPFFQGSGYFIEKQGNDPFSFRSGQVVWIFQHLDEIKLVQSFEAPDFWCDIEI